MFLQTHLMLLVTPELFSPRAPLSAISTLGQSWRPGCNKVLSQRCTVVSPACCLCNRQLSAAATASNLLVCLESFFAVVYAVVVSLLEYVSH